MKDIYFVHYDKTMRERQSDGVEFCVIPEFHDNKIYFYCNEYMVFWKVYYPRKTKQHFLNCYSRRAKITIENEEDNIMSKKRTVYTAEYKTRLVLEVLKEDKTLSEIASENKITPLNLRNWKKIFLENAEMAMEPSKAIKEQKEANKKLKSMNLDFCILMSPIYQSLKNKSTIYS